MVCLGREILGVLNLPKNFNKLRNEIELNYLNLPPQKKKVKGSQTLYKIHGAF